MTHGRPPTFFERFALLYLVGVLIGILITLAACATAPRPRPPVISTTTTSTTQPPVTIEPHPGGGTCANPSPGPVARMEVKIHVTGPNWITIDATPSVGKRVPSSCDRDPDFCRSVGFTDGRGFCPPRAEGNPERGQCDHFVTGGGLVWSFFPAKGDAGLVTCYDSAGHAGTCADAPDGTQMHPEGWMLQVRPTSHGVVKVCPRVLSGCPHPPDPGADDDTANGCGRLVLP